MHKKTVDVIKILVIGILLPAVFASCVLHHFREPDGENIQPTDTQGETTQPPRQPIMIRVILEDAPVEMELEAYLLGVMLAEIPADFDYEALKAQAVASRTYTLLYCNVRKTHTVGAVCTKSTCCQAYLPEEHYLAQGGSEQDVQTMRYALEDTAGQVLTYGGQLIAATYFSCSGGKTEDAGEVWGAAFPYLQSVESPGEQIASFFEDEITFTPEEFQAALGATMTGDPADWFGHVQKTKGGGVAKMRIGGVWYQGTTLRTLLGLRSTAFTVTVENGNIHIATKGYGHRVGMSQYGAEAMALAGNSYTQILQHYYTGTSLEQYEPQEGEKS